MSIVLEAIMPYNFRNLSDNEAATKELYSIQTRLQSVWPFRGKFENTIYEGDKNEIQPEYLIDLPEFEIELKNGFLYIPLYFKKCQYFAIDNGVQWLRNALYDLVTALGGDMAYVGSEYQFCEMYNGRDWYETDFTLEDWLIAHPQIPDYDENERADFPRGPIWGELFKDSFEQCKKRRNYLEELFPEHKILSISRLKDNLILAVNSDKGFVLLDEFTREEIVCAVIEGKFSCK